ncbi:DUF2945 domain-containing protein [Pseudooceanicola nanhaiensis]|jgi:hypothetical protein|uniref:DUF2945 domain-containing protein n=1 Tax=Pseudooceanicola nanhaiensis TaxID=375761 RepID=UPI00405A07BA
MQKGTQVKWNWGQGTAEGKVSETFDRKVTRTLDGSEITRNGTRDNPALLIRQDDGSEVLKLSSEVDRA